MGIFGWSYPPGCSGTPFDDVPDDSECAYCGQEMPEAALEDETSWPFQGYCDAQCALLQIIQSDATFPDDLPEDDIPAPDADSPPDPSLSSRGQLRRLVMRALREVLPPRGPTAPRK